MRHTAVSIVILSCWGLSLSTVRAADPARQGGAVASPADSTKVTGTLVVPAGVPSFRNLTVEIKLFRYDPRLADVSADLVDAGYLKDYQHQQGKETRTAFAIGTKPGAKTDAKKRYYVTLFITKDGRRTHMGQCAHRKGLCLVLTQGHPREITMTVKSLGRPARRKVAPGRGRPARPRPLPRPGPKPKAKGTDFDAFRKAQHLFTGTLKAVQAGPVGMSYPPLYTHKLKLEVKEVLRGGLQVGQEITARHSARQVKPPTFPEGDLCIVAALRARGAFHVSLIKKSTDKLLAMAKTAVSVPLGWSMEKDKLLSPWAALGEKAWPKDAKTQKDQKVCSKTGRPALLAGKGLRFEVSPVPPKKKIKWTNPDGDGQYNVTVSNTTKQPLTVPALLSDGKKILWNESLVVLCQDKAQPAPGCRPLTAVPKATVLQPGQSVSTVLNAFLLKGLRWPRGGYRIQFQFCLGELSATHAFYYLSRHHDKTRAAVVKAKE